MVMHLDGELVADRETEYGVEVMSGTVAECDDEQTARGYASLLGGRVLRREVYVTEWTEA